MNCERIKKRRKFKKDTASVLFPWVLDVGNLTVNQQKLICQRIKTGIEAVSVLERLGVFLHNRHYKS